MDSKIYDEWLKINVEIHNKLSTLKTLEREKKHLIEEAERGLSEDLKIKMSKNIREYEELLNSIGILKQRAEKLKEKIN